MAFHMWVEIFKRVFLDIGKNCPFGEVWDFWFRFESQERSRVHLHGVVWCEANSIPDDVICPPMPPERAGFDPTFTAYLQDLYRKCNMVHQCHPDKCLVIGCGGVCTKCKSCRRS